MRIYMNIFHSIFMLVYIYILVLDFFLLWIMHACIYRHDMKVQISTSKPGLEGKNSDACEATCAFRL